MKVDELQAYLLTWPLPRPLRRPVYGGEVTLFKRDCLLVRARTDRGHTGYGSGTPSPNVAQLINRNLRAAVVGLNPGNLSGLRKKVFQRRPHYPGLVQAFAAIEMALLDLQGQIKSCSLSELLGGRIRQRIRLCASGGVYLDPEEGAREASLWANSGFSACKLGLGCSPSQDLETVRRIRQACPRPWGIAVDARAWWRQNYGLDEIGRLLQEMAPSHLEWVEVPVPLEDLQAIRRVKEVCPIPISGGSAEPSLEGWVGLAARGVPGHLAVGCAPSWGADKRSPGHKELGISWSKGGDRQPIDSTGGVSPGSTGGLLRRTIGGLDGMAGLLEGRPFGDLRLPAGGGDFGAPSLDGSGRAGGSRRSGTGCQGE